VCVACSLYNLYKTWLGPTGVYIYIYDDEKASGIALGMDKVASAMDFQKP
jgi:hypothetical protein